MPASFAKQVARKVVESLAPPSLVVWHGRRRGRRVALTFDDGPTLLTRAYLDVLDRHGARATFFVVGAQCREHPELVWEIAGRGHELGAHGYSHRPFPELSSDLPGELRRTRELLPGTCRFVRPPYGELSPGTFLACARAGLTTVLWSKDSGDWRTTDAMEIERAVRPGALDPGAIVLLHEGQEWTLDALAKIVSRLSESGYEMVTVGRLLDA